MKRWLIGSLILLAGCGSPAKPTQTVLRMAIASDIETLDPREARSTAAQVTCKMLYDGLMRIDEQGKPIPSLAQVISISPDHRTYTVTLQEALWTDGQPVTAHDFEQAWKSILSPSNGFECASMLYCLNQAQVAHAGEADLDAVGVKALNDQLLVIYLERPTPHFLELLASPVFGPIPSHLEGSRGKKISVTNGPFQVDRISPGSQLVLKKNETYWDAEAVEVDQIVLKVVPDPMTAVSMYQQEELDWIGSPLAELPQDYAQRAMAQGELRTVSLAATLWYKCNIGRPPLDNAKLRKALSLAIDRQEIVDHVLKLGQTPTKSPLPPALAVTNRRASEDDRAAARKLLQEALDEMGITKEQLPPITLTYSNNGRVSKLTQAVQQQWKINLGLNIRLEATEFKTLLARMGKMDYQMGGAKIWISDYQDPADILNIYAQDGGLNETGWQNKTYARLLERAGFENDAERRRELFASAEAILMDEMPIIPLCDHTYCYQKRDFTGERIPPAGCPDFKWVRAVSNL